MAVRWHANKRRESHGFSSCRKWCKVCVLAFVRWSDFDTTPMNLPNQGTDDDKILLKPNQGTELW
jgi:hypothetical protein